MNLIKQSSDQLIFSKKYFGCWLFIILFFIPALYFLYKSTPVTFHCDKTHNQCLISRKFLLIPVNKSIQLNSVKEAKIDYVYEVSKMPRRKKREYKFYYVYLSVGDKKIRLTSPRTDKYGSSDERLIADKINEYLNSKEINILEIKDRGNNRDYQTALILFVISGIILLTAKLKEQWIFDKKNNSLIYKKIKLIAGKTNKYSLTDLKDINIEEINENEDGEKTKTNRICFELDKVGKIPMENDYNEELEENIEKAGIIKAFLGRV